MYVVISVSVGQALEIIKDTTQKEVIHYICVHDGKVDFNSSWITKEKMKWS